jgi:type IV pilus assembly protein PilE
MNSTKGFTLIEIITAIAIIAILASIAIPQYNDYTIRGKIAEATSALSDGRIKMEQFFQDNRTYAGGPTPTATTYFTYTVSGTSATAYLITAQGVGSMAAWTMTIDQNNVRSTTAAPAGWTAATMPSTCWITRKAGVC